MLAPVHLLIVFAAAFVAGGINSIAGGGTLITFPTLIWLGIDSKAANMTSTVALWPGSLGSAFGYRHELRASNRQVFAMIVPSIVGGVIGAVLLELTPTDTFDALLPWLILFATLLFMAQEPIQRRLKLDRPTEPAGHWLSWTLGFQLAVAIYGGYFGAGIGILMLAALSLMGHSDIHQMNGIKNVLAICINGVAALYFVYLGNVIWQDAAVMAIGSICGGVGGAGVARRLGRQTVRRIVVAVGFAMALSMMLRG